MATITVPDLGSEDKSEVIEIHVSEGDAINVDDSLITLESEKATMEIPASDAGIVKKLLVSIGDKIGNGDAILEIEGGSAETAEPKQEESKPEKSETEKPAETKKPAATEAPAPVSIPGNIYTSPVVRRLAHEFGVDLTQVKATGPKGRILKSDIQEFVKARLAGGGGGGSGLPTMPEVDHSKFGEVEAVELNKIKRLTGKNLHRNWVVIPHVTQFDEADITELENFRQENKKQAEKQGFKLTPLVFIMKAAVSALKACPTFNASLSSDGTQLFMKRYFHIGVAVDTPNGLVVPVIRDVDRTGAFELAQELGEISKKARDGKLMPVDMQGSCFTISSLGGIGGTAFTPIVNSPDVAILGVSKSDHKPKYLHGEWIPRLMLPLALSYDHRVIDGAEAARFITHISQYLADMRKLVL